MLARITTAFLLATVSISAAEVTRDLTKRTHVAADYVTPGEKVTFKVTNALPHVTYVDGASNLLREKTDPPATGAAPAACTGDFSSFLRVALKDVKLEENIESTFVKATEAFTQPCKDKAKDDLKLLTTFPAPITKVMPAESFTFEIHRADDKDRKWSVTLEPRKTQEQVAAAAAAATKDTLDTQRELIDKHSSLIVMKCSYADEKCASSEIFVNADQDSTVYITDVPKSKQVTITASADEFFPCPALRYNMATFTESTGTVVVSLHAKRNFLGIWPAKMDSLENEAAAHYGLDWCPGEDRVFQKTSVFGNDLSAVDFEAEARGRIRRRMGVKHVEDAGDPRLLPIQPPRNSIPLFLRGRSEVVKIDVRFDNEVKTFTIPVRYQRFWVDAGGFFVFSRHVDESLEYEPVSATDTTRTVKRIIKDTSVAPVTGIVINIHPGNFPVLAFQFGLAANQGKLPSYYLGLGMRARTIGKRGLATIGTGIAMQQEDRFNNTEAGETFPTDSPRLIASKKYGFNPYLSVSLGFSFGGVSEKTDVKAAVTSSD